MWTALPYLLDRVMTQTASNTHRARRLARVATTWVVALLVLGFACPHCRVSGDAGSPVGPSEPSAHAHSTPPCHAEAPIDADPSSPPMADCECDGCDGLAESVPPAQATFEPNAHATWLALPPHPWTGPAPATATAGSRAHWIPPPYPGFAENTVVLLN